MRAFSDQPELRRNVKYLMWVDDIAFSNLLSKINLNYKLHHPERRELCRVIGDMGLRYHEERAVRRAI
jgi:hypothetical protein